MENIDPYNYFPDTSVAAWDVQDMEFVGWIQPDNRMNILSEELNSEGEVFNGQYLSYIDGLSIYSQDDLERDVDRVSILSDRDSGNSVDRLYVYWKLIPSEWDLGDSDYPEKWLFSVVGDQVLVEAQPLDLDHQLFPIVTCAPDTDGFSATPISKMETIHGLQQFVNFLYNSHIANIRKAVHDMFVVDPERINLNDMRSPGPGLLIRTRKKAWGQGVKDAVEQLKVSDVTANHVQESVAVNLFVERATGAADFLQGILRGGERRTAEEVRTVGGGALSRLEKTAMIASIQALQPLGYMVASQTQQFLSREQYVRIIGRNEDDLRKEFGDTDRALVNPLNILVDYDVEVNDGSLPDQSDPNVWLQVYQALLQNPEATQEIDSTRVFKYMAKILGAKNIEQFARQEPPEVNAEVQDDENVLREVEKGNLIPTPGA